MFDNQLNSSVVNSFKMTKTYQNTLFEQSLKGIFMSNSLF